MSRYTERQKEVINFLENLVTQRFNEETLNKTLSDFFGEPIEVENNTQLRIDNNDFSCEEDLPTDYNLMFNIETEDDYGYFDIYMLPMRRAGFDYSTMYITEVGYEFE
jgi:RNA binding exosome subunit